MLPIFRNNTGAARKFSEAFAGVHFLYSLFFAVTKPTMPGGFYSEFLPFGEPWSQSAGITASFGLDGLTGLLTVFTSFMFLCATALGKSTVKNTDRTFYALLTLLFGCTIGIFAAKDMFLFFAYWIAEIVPVYMLTARYGSGKATKSARRYALYLITGSMLLLSSMSALYCYGFALNGEAGSSIDFLRTDLSDGISSPVVQILMFTGFFAGFGTKIPIIPFHSAITDVLTDAPTPVAMMISACLIKTGIYGLIRFNIELFPQIYAFFAPGIMIVAVIGIIWTIFCAYGCENLKRIVAYLSIAGAGTILLGLCSLTKYGLDGAMFQIFAHGFATAALILTAGIIAKTYGTTFLGFLGGIGTSRPLFMLTTYTACFALVGIPLTAGFPGLFLIFLGCATSDFGTGMLPVIVTITAIFAAILTACCVSKIIHDIFCGKSTHETKKDLNGRNAKFMIIFCCAAIIFGLYPDALFSIVSDVSDEILTIIAG